MSHYARLIGEILAEIPPGLPALQFKDKSILVFSASPLSLAAFRSHVRDWNNATLFSPAALNSLLPSVKYGIYCGEAGSNETMRGAVADGASVAVFLWPLWQTSGRLLLALARLGIREFVFLERSGWERYSGWSAVCKRIYCSVSESIWKPSLTPRSPSIASDAAVPASFEPFMNHKDEARFPQSPRPLKVIHYISSLYPGGAERQACFLAAELKRRGHDIRIGTTWPSQGERDHYSKILERGGVPYRSAGDPPDTSNDGKLIRAPIDFAILKQLPDGLREHVLGLLGEVLLEKPDVLHASLDHPNIVAGIAGLIASVPVIVFSMRNVNPTNFPRFYFPWMKTWYDFLVRSPRVHLIANSHNGARDYAQWLGIAPDRFTVILNGVDFNEIHRPDPAEAAAFRASVGLSPDTPVVTGIFRIDPEKRPLTFVDVIRRVVKTVPGLKVIIAGIGTLEAEMKAEIEKAGLSGHFIFLGRRSDVPVIMAASDVMLLTSLVEGTPNVLLEAQYVGCPPVATLAGGTSDAVADKKTGLLHAVDDIEGLAQSVAMLLQNREMRETFKTAGPQFVEKQFGLNRMVDETVNLYHKAFHWNT